MEASAAVVDRRDGRRAELVGLPHAHPSLDATTGHPHREAVGVVIAAGPLGILGRRLPAELPPPDHERAVEEPGALEILQQRRDRLIGVAGVEIVILLEIPVGIPVVVVVGPAGIELHEAHAALNEPPGEEAAAAEVGGARVGEAVKGLRLGRLARQIDRLRSVLLHLPGELVGGDPGGKLGVVAAREKMRAVLRPEGVEERPLALERHVVWGGEIENRRPLRSQQRPLIGRRHVATRPILGAGDRPAGGVEHDDEAGEILVDAPEPVVDP